MSQFKVYPTRWYILGVFSSMIFLQGYIFNQWGSIYESMSEVFHWNDRQVAILAFYATLTYALFVIPSSMAVERFGLRKIIILSACLIFLGCVLKCFAFIHNDSVQTVLIHISAFINGIPGCTVWYGPLVISSRWFKPNERKLATALGTLTAIAGNATAFILGPVIIGQPGTAGVTTDSMRSRYFYLIWAETGLAAVLLTLTLLYFPEYPKTPSSLSAKTKRIEYWPAIKILLKSKNFWLCFFPFVLFTGAYQAWSPCYPVIIKSAGISGKKAGIIAFWGHFAGVTLGILVGKVADMFGNLKALAIAPILLCLEGGFWLVLISNNYIPYQERSVWMCTILCYVAFLCFLPILLEMSVELCYPVDESIVAALLSIMVFLESSVVLIILFFPEISVNWMHWFLLASSLLALPFVIWLPTTYRRTIVDEQLEDSVRNHGEMFKGKVRYDEFGISSQHSVYNSYQ